MRRLLIVALALAAVAGLVLWRRSRGDAAAGVGPRPPATRYPIRPPAPSGPTRDELYARAKELDIKGRSKMSKAELARAVAEHKRD